jgi:NifB/MoaA-like Fe-S oxidoreductase
VASVSVVPVGLTKYREGLCPLEPVGPDEARAVIGITDGFGDRFFEKFGTRLVYCADELYLKAGVPVPKSDYYEDFPQIENGVGMLASFEDEVRAALSGAIRPRPRRLRSPRGPGRKVLCAGWLNYWPNHAII